ncbi:MAG TPA: hypothetical protein VKU41_00255, partial [Polyangiaceae bacterium]|nr:hypothetical protein [Polyangiaceae bacterium]
MRHGPTRAVTVFRLAPLAVLAVATGEILSCGSGSGSAAPHAQDAGVALDATMPPPVAARVHYDGLPPAEAGPRTPVAAETVSSRVNTMQLMFAAGEMQTSGEPFASNFAGRNLAGYDRYYLPPDQYLINSCQGCFFVTVTDLFGFSTAVESYEYSKYH